MNFIRPTRIALACLPLLVAPGLAGAQSRDVTSRLAALESAVTTLTQNLANANSANAGLNTQLQSQAAAISALQAALAREVADRRAYADSVGASTLAAAKTYSDARLAPVADKLVHFSRAGNEISIAGANLNILSGGPSQGVNGLGNLVIGYNTLRGGANAVNQRTGSHNLVLGFGNNYTSWGSIVGGGHNTVSAAVTAVISGSGHTASGNYAVIGGGYANQASGAWSFIGGGTGKAASAQLANMP